MPRGESWTGANAKNQQALIILTMHHLVVRNKNSLRLPGDEGDFNWKNQKENSKQKGEYTRTFKIKTTGASLVVEWLRICLPMQGTLVQSLVGELRSTMPWGN